MKLATEEAQRVLWGMLDGMRGSDDIANVGYAVTSLFTVKVLVDNRDYFQIPDVGDWKAIYAPGEDVSKRLREKIDFIEQQIPQLTRVFTEIDWESVDFKLLYRLLQQLEQIDTSYEEAENPDPLNGTISLVADAWFERLSDMSGRGGEFSSPKQISELCAQLLEVRTGSVYDGTAGISGMLIEAAREAVRNGNLIPHLYGQEINKRTWSLAHMNFILHGVTSARVALGDVLMHPKWIEDDRRLQRFKYVTMSAPFALRFTSKDSFEEDHYRRYQYGTPSAAYADMAFVQHAIASMDETGKAVLVQTHGALFRGGMDAEIRSGILEDHLIETVVFLPRNLLQNTGIPIALLVLNKQNPHPGYVLFVKADEGFQPGRIQNVLRPQDVERICDTVRNTREIEGYSRVVSVQEILRNDANLNYTRYFDVGVVDSKIGSVEVSLQMFEDSFSGRTVRLTDIADVRRGYGGASKDTDVGESEAIHRLVNLGDVDEHGIHIEKTTLVAGDLRKLEFNELKPGDVLLSSRGTALKVAVVEDTPERLVASQNFIVIRVRKDVDPYFLKTYLESPVGIQLLQALQRGTAVPVISHKDIRELVVPNLPLEVQRQIGEASQRAEQELWKGRKEAERQYKERYCEIYGVLGIAAAIQDADSDR